MYQFRDGRRSVGITDNEVETALELFRFYGGPLDPYWERDAMAHAIAAVDSMRAQREAEERAHARRRDGDADFVKAIAQARQRTAIHLAEPQ